MVEFHRPRCNVVLRSVTICGKTYFREPVSSLIKRAGPGTLQRRALAAAFPTAGQQLLSDGAAEPAVPFTPALPGAAPRWDPLTPSPLPTAEPDPQGTIQSPRAPPAAAQVRGAPATPPRRRRRRSRGGQASPAPRSVRLRSPRSRPRLCGAGKLFPSRSPSRRRSSLPSRPSHLRGAPAGPGWRGAAGAGGAAEAPCRRVPRLRRLRGGSGSVCEEEPPAAAALPPALRPPPPRAAGIGPRCHMTRRLSPCQAPRAGGVSAGRVTEGSAGGRLPPAGWRLRRGPRRVSEHKQPGTH